jgi:hypothetical protein
MVFALILHLAGMVMWMGGGFSSMVIGIKSRSEERVTQGAATRLQAHVHRILIAPGALLTVASGVYLSVLAMNTGTPPSAWLMVMQGAGVLAALLVLFVTVPTSFRLSRVNPVGEGAAAFDALRRRIATAGTIAGTLAVLALVAGVLGRFGIARP